MQGCAGFHKAPSSINKELRKQAIAERYSTVYNSLLSNYTESNKVIARALDQFAKVTIAVSERDRGGGHL